MAETPHGAPSAEATEVVQLRVSAELYRAFQRCMWIIIHETGRSQLEIMDEVVRDFLRKHQC
ncbi:MAG TPA: hypothetical protein VLL73_05090 [Desulfurivibrionaceae bacterium]|nr:hypothetical protein [Desulfurivibrionaceae bacterium]